MSSYHQPVQTPIGSKTEEMRTEEMREDYHFFGFRAKLEMMLSIWDFF